MSERREEFESAHWTVDVEEETDRPFWRGAGSGDKEETVFDQGDPLIMRPEHFPPGTRIVVIEPWDEEFYSRLLDNNKRNA